MAEHRVLVTGACGFLGSHFVDHLIRQPGLRVRATDLASVDRTFLNSEAEFIASDLRDPASLRRVVQGVSIIYHVASLFRYSAKWDELYAVNVEGTQQLCKAAIGVGVSKILLVSSAGVYGLPRFLPIREEDSKHPSNPYERSKWEQEQVLREACEAKNLDYVILRPAPIYGPRNQYGIATVIKMIARGQLPIIPENLNGLVPLVHVADVVGAALHLVDYPKAVGEVYNVVDDSVYRKYDLFSYIAPLLEAKIYHTNLPLFPRFLLKALGAWSEWKARHITHSEPKVEKATIEMMYQSYWFSNAKLKATGYCLLYPDSRVGLKDTIDWYKLHNWL